MKICKFCQAVLHFSRRLQEVLKLDLLELGIYICDMLLYHEIDYQGNYMPHYDYGSLLLLFPLFIHFLSFQGKYVSHFLRNC